MRAIAMTKRAVMVLIASERSAGKAALDDPGRDLMTRRASALSVNQMLVASGT